MKVNREDFLQCLNSVASGLSSREVIEQSSCFVFNEGTIHTFNEEIACSIKTDVKIKGAIQAKPLLALLKKLKEETIELELKDGELIVKGRNKRAGIKTEHQIVLPIDDIKIPKKWKKLDPDFSEAIYIASGCAGTDESQFSLTCININPKWVEACDNFQVTRYPLKTDIKQATLVKKSSIKHITDLNMVEFAETSTYMHFRSQSGLVLSCRRYIEDFPDLSGLLEVKGSKIALPKGLEEASDKGAIFTAENVDNNQIDVEIKEGELTITGTGSSGWYKERKKTNYKGKSFSFMINPTMLQKIVKEYNECLISPERLKVDAGKYVYVTCLGKKSNE